MDNPPEWFWSFAILVYAAAFLGALTALVVWSLMTGRARPVRAPRRPGAGRHALPDPSGASPLDGAEPPVRTHVPVS